MKQVKFFRPNWPQINKAIEAYSLKELRDQQKKMNDAIQKKIDLVYQAKRLKEVADKLKALKDLPLDTEVFYIGRNPAISFGLKGLKKKDGRKYMTVEFDNMRWNIVYTNIQTEPPSTNQELSNKLSKRLDNILNK